MLLAMCQRCIFIFISFPNIKKIRDFKVPCPSYINMIQDIIKEAPLIDVEEGFAELFLMISLLKFLCRLATWWALSATFPHFA